MDFKSAFQQAYSQEKITYDARAIITADAKLFPLGTDTKVRAGRYKNLEEFRAWQTEAKKRE